MNTTTQSEKSRIEVDDLSVKDDVTGGAGVPLRDKEGNLAIGGMPVR